MMSTGMNKMSKLHSLNGMHNQIYSRNSLSEQYTKYYELRAKQALNSTTGASFRNSINLKPSETP